MSHQNHSTTTPRTVYRSDPTCPVCREDMPSPGIDPLSGAAVGPDTQLFCPTSIAQDGCPTSDQPNGERPGRGAWVPACRKESLVKHLGDLDQSAVVILLCGHRMHAECLQATLLQSDNRCPTCHEKAAYCSESLGVAPSRVFQQEQAESDRHWAEQLDLQSVTHDAKEGYEPMWDDGQERSRESSTSPECRCKR